MDPTQTNPILPSGHPFSNVVKTAYWSATTSSADANSSSAWGVNFYSGLDFLDKGGSFYAWCVRGGQGVDPQ